MSKLEEEKCVSELPGVGPKTHEKMRDLGVKTIRHLRDRVANELCSENSPNDVAEILKLKLGVRYVIIFSLQSREVLMTVIGVIICPISTGVSVRV